MILLANEFLDALPIRQFVRRGDGWTERFVADGAWVEQPGRRGRRADRPRAVEGDVVEVNEPARAFVADVAARLAAMPGRRCSWTTARRTARRATACRRWRTNARSIRCRRRDRPT